MAGEYNADSSGAAEANTAAPAPPEDGEQQDDQSSEENPVFPLPPEYPGAENLKKGDKITLIVVDVDGEGGVQVQCDPKMMAAKGGDGAKPTMMESFDEEMK